MASVRLQLFGRGFELTAKAMREVSSSRGGWLPLVVREPYTGAWQVNVEAVGARAGVFGRVRVSP